jgi:hypothetical protein
VSFEGRAADIHVDSGTASMRASVISMTMLPEMMGMIVRMPVSVMRIDIGRSASPVALFSA